MHAAALVAWIATATGGLTLAAIWLARGGWSRPQDVEEKITTKDAKRLAPLGISLHMLVPHALLAVVGLVLWAAFTASRDDYEQVKIAGPLILTVVVTLGALMWSWARRAQRSRVRVPEDGLPGVVVLLHGLGAAITVVLVIIALAQ